MRRIGLASIVLSTAIACAATNASARTPAQVLAAAIDANDLARVEATLDAGASPNLEGYNDLPLHAALRQRRERIAQLLIERGADPDLRNRRGDSALAFLSPQEALAQSRIDSGIIALAIYASNQRLICARELAPQTVHLVLSRSHDVDSMDATQMTPLMRAAMCGHANTLRTLLAAGAAADTRNARGETALHFAAAAGAPNTLELLLSDSDVDVRDTAGASPLARAAAGPSQGHVRAAELLLAAGAAVNAIDAAGNTPLMVAAEGENTEMAQLLLRSGADPSLHNAEGRNAHAIARGAMRDLIDGAGRQ